MALVDYERAWLQLKADVVERNSWGQRDLLRAMAKAELDSRLPEGQEGTDPGPLPARRDHLRAAP